MTATQNVVLEAPPSLEELWLPFTANKAFKKAPRLLGASHGMYYTSTDGRSILDGCAGLWCVNAGHGREPIVRAIAETAANLDFAPAFQMGHPLSFALATELAKLLPGDIDHVFFAGPREGEDEVEMVGREIERRMAVGAAFREPGELAGARRERTGVREN